MDAILLFYIGIADVFEEQVGNSPCIMKEDTKPRNCSGTILLKAFSASFLTLSLPWKLPNSAPSILIELSESLRNTV